MHCKNIILSLELYLYISVNADRLYFMNDITICCWVLQVPIQPDLFPDIRDWTDSPESYDEHATHRLCAVQGSHRHCQGILLSVMQQQAAVAYNIINIMIITKICTVLQIHKLINRDLISVPGNQVIV